MILIQASSLVKNMLLMLDPVWRLRSVETSATDRNGILDPALFVRLFDGLVPFMRHLLVSAIVGVVIIAKISVSE